MGKAYGDNLKLSLYGASHAPAVGMVLEGVPAGEKIDMKKLQAFLDRRAPGRNDFSSARKESDVPEFLSGLDHDETTGGPIEAVIHNTDVRPKDYDEYRYVPRPGHADYTAAVTYGKALKKESKTQTAPPGMDMSGGGPFSGRMTAPLCIAGGILKQLLELEGIHIFSRIAMIGGIDDAGEMTEDLSKKAFPTVSDEQGKKMQERILKAKEDGDSVGGIVECVVTGLPVGLGGPLFEGMESRIAEIVFAIPAVKGIEFGEGFNSAKLTGSENNDAFIVENGKVRTKTNHAGGILGGITNAMPLTFRTAFKPTPSIAKLQQSVDLKTMDKTELRIKGRHDACIVPRALPCVEAAAAVAVYDTLLGRRKELSP